MTYHAAISPGAAQTLGCETVRSPYFECDLCHASKSCYTKRGDVAQWMLKRRGPPGWREIQGIPSPGHLCSDCLKKLARRAG